MQPFSKSQISKGNKTLAERNEVQTDSHRHDPFPTFNARSRKNRRHDWNNDFNWKECGYPKPGNSHGPISTQLNQNSRKLSTSL